MDMPSHPALGSPDLICVSPFAEVFLMSARPFAPHPHRWLLTAGRPIAIARKSGLSA